MSEESLMRNLYIGMRDARRYGNTMQCGWLLDNFGHCSQSPQIHAIFGLDDIFVWRGPAFADDDISSEFIWEGTDGTRITAHFLVSGYRNFYNLADTTAYIDLRVKQLKDMLAPFAPYQHLIFLDGYDIDIWPEDPFQFLGETEEFVRSTPERYSEAVRHLQNPEDIPVIRGELSSGKYACVFPGSLSARTYLKIENALIERILAYYLEPLQAIVRRAGIETEVSETESLWRALLRTQLHDSIGGVSVDQVHDKMEATYRRIYSQAQTLIAGYLRYIPSLLDLQTGKYVFLPSPFEYQHLWVNGNDKTYLVSSEGTGFYQIEQDRTVAGNGQEVDAYIWENDFYTVEFTRDGVTLNGQPAGGLLLERDAGDTYNADPEPFDEEPVATIKSVRLVEERGEYARIALLREVAHEDVLITTRESIFMSRGPVLEWNLSVDSWGADYRLRFTYETGDASSGVFAKMPFDICRRPREDTDYFEDDLPQALRPVLLAAREVGSVSDFPFQGFVALSDGNTTQAVFAKGLREYEVDETGRISITLKRSVEWLAKSELRTRVGDAGPYMCVPAARDERSTQFELALVDLTAGVRSREFLKWFYLFEYGHLLFENKGFEGSRSAVSIWNERLPWSGIQSMEDGESIMRVYNPYLGQFRFSQTHMGANPFGQPMQEVTGVAQNGIEHLVYDPCPRADGASIPSFADVEMIDFPEWPAGKDHSTVDDGKLDELRDTIGALKQEQSEARQRLAQLSEDADQLLYHRTKHTTLRLEREILEAEISILLNELKRQSDKAEIRDEIRAVGRELNLARRRRRTYDYVLSLFEDW